MLCMGSDLRQWTTALAVPSVLYTLVVSVPANRAEGLPSKRYRPLFAVANQFSQLWIPLPHVM